MCPLVDPQVADGLDADAYGVAGQVGDRDLVHLDDLDGPRVGPGGGGVHGLILGPVEDLVAALCADREDPVHDVGDVAGDPIGDPPDLVAAEVRTWLGAHGPPRFRRVTCVRRRRRVAP